MGGPGNKNSKSFQDSNEHVVERVDCGLIPCILEEQEKRESYSDIRALDQIGLREKWQSIWKETELSDVLHGCPQVEGQGDEREGEGKEGEKDL